LFLLKNSLASYFTSPSELLKQEREYSNALYGANIRTNGA